MLRYTCAWAPSTFSGTVQVGENFVTLVLAAVVRLTKRQVKTVHRRDENVAREEGRNLTDVVAVSHLAVAVRIAKPTNGGGGGRVI